MVVGNNESRDEKRHRCPVDLPSNHLRYFLYHDIRLPPWVHVWYGSRFSLLAYFAFFSVGTSNHWFGSNQTVTFWAFIGLGLLYLGLGCIKIVGRFLPVFPVYLFARLVYYQVFSQCVWEHMGLSSSPLLFMVLKERALHHLQSPSDIRSIHAAVVSYFEARLFISSIDIPLKDDNWVHVFELDNYFQHYSMSRHNWLNTHLLLLAYHKQFRLYVRTFKKIQKLSEKDKPQELGIDYKIGELLSEYDLP